MTYKDAMRIFTGIMERIVGHFPHQFALEMDSINGINDIREFNKTVTKKKKKANKYRWHDLRENICDLPRVINGYGESDYLLVKTERCDTEIACYSYIKKQWSIDGNIFAWRYIEPFKDEECRFWDE